MTPLVRPAPRRFADSWAQSIAEVLRGDERIGLGFFLDERIVVTCSHVVQSAGSNLRIRVPAGERSVQLVYDNPEKDVAFLKLDARVSGFELCPMELETDAIPGAAIQFVGWSQAAGAVRRAGPHLHSNRIQNMASSAMRPSSSPCELYELGEDCQPGYSGGPVVLEGQGRACGMIVARDPSVARAFAIPGGVLEECFRAVVAKRENRRRSSIWSILALLAATTLTVPVGAVTIAYLRQRNLTNEMRKIQRTAEKIDRQMDSVIGVDGESANHSGAVEREYHDTDGQCLGKDSWENGRLARRVLYQPQQHDGCDKVIAVDTYEYQSDDPKDRTWRWPSKKVREYPDERRQIYLRDEFTATGLFKEKEYCKDGFGRNGCDHGRLIADDMRSELPALILLPAFAVYR